MTVKTRFAPSPTGYLHIGSLRTVLYNYLYTKQNNGKFLLRIEDTDRSRFVEGSQENLIKILHTVGLYHDEGPGIEGPSGPYLQSERLDIYAKYIKIILEKDHAYHCFCTSEELTAKREQQQELGLPTKYDGTCRYLSESEISEKLAANTPYTVRLKVPKNEDVVFIDKIKGKILVNTKDVDDQVLLKTDGFPTYHFAVVVDDHLMGITDVIRGDEWIPSTPKHILLYKAFGWDAPVFSHVPPLVGADRKKLSKRTGDVAAEVFIAKGYLPEAIINYLALLGWNPKTTEEFFTMDELIERFDIMNVHKAGAFFDIERLDFFCNHYIKNKDSDKLFTDLASYLEKYDAELLDIIGKRTETFNIKVLDEVKGRMKKLSDFKELTPFFYGNSGIPDKELVVNPKMKITDIDVAISSLELTLDILENSKSDFESMDEMKTVFIDKIKEAEMKNGQVLWPTRCALSGEQFSPGAFEMIFVLGNEESKKRIKNTIDHFKK